MVISDSKTFGEALKKRRKELGYTQRYMRKTVGQGLIMTVGCGVLIENDKDQVLLQKRSDTGEWCVPGGAMEPGETYIEAATSASFSN